MQLRAEEAAVVEKAVRLAIESVMNVLCAVNSARTYELQRLVADRDREIQRLEGRVRETEAELRLVLRPGSPSPAPGSVSVPVPEQRGGVDVENTADQREQCEVRVSLALLAPPSQDLPIDLDQSSSSKAQSELCPSDRAVQPEPLCPSEVQVQPELSCSREEAHVRESSHPTERRLKQERLYPSPGRIKVEPLSPERNPLHQDSLDSPAAGLRRAVSEELSFRVQGALGHSDPWPSVSAQAEEPAPGPHAPPTVPWRSRSSVSRREQSEEAMRRRRASWRAASRRYYARKMARLQIHSNLQNHTHHQSHSTSLQSHTNSLQSHSNSLQSHTNSLQSHSTSLQSHSTSLQSHSNSLQSHLHQQSHTNSPASGSQFGPGSESWRYSVCDLTPLLQPLQSSTDGTFMTESDLLNDSLT